MVAVVDVAENVKSWPVPESATVCGLPGALPVMVSVPLRLPLAEGSKKTPIVQLTPGARLLVQPLVSPKSALACTLEMVSATSPVLLTVTFCGSPVVPTN